MAGQKRGQEHAVGEPAPSSPAAGDRCADRQQGPQPTATSGPARAASGQQDGGSHGDDQRPADTAGPVRAGRG